MTGSKASLGYLAYLLQAIPGIGPTRLAGILRRIREKHIEPAEFFALSDAKLWAQFGLKTDAKALLIEPAERTVGIWHQLLELQASILIVGEPEYPAKLAATLGESAPPILYSRGNLDLLHAPSVGFAGSRRASEKGLQVAQAAAAQLARERIDVVSGYANGVDLAAHRGALLANGTTTLILAEGILHFRLKDELRSVLGEDWRNRILVLSEFPPGLPWRAHNAMTRNHTICGLTDAVVVIESGLEGGTFEAGKTALALRRPLFCVEYSEPAPSAEGNAYFLANGALSLRRGKNGEPNMSRLLDVVRGAPMVASAETARDEMILHEDSAMPKAQPVPPPSPEARSIPVTCKRLIEVDFPIAKVSEYSAKEKSIRHGHPSTLHLWWARRPLAACRAVLLGLLLPDPCDKDCPKDFNVRARSLLSKRHSKSLKTDLDLRDDLLQFIGEFANWDLAADATYLEIARGLVKAAHPEETPVVADPFAGGGSIPLEALRLGCEAFASDLNPVACLILKTLLEDIPFYGNAEFKLSGTSGKEVVVHGLADALRHVGKQVKEAAEKELAEFYPIDPDGSRPIAYLWARTVRCEGIGCGAEIPLVRSFWLCKKKAQKRALGFRIERTKSRLSRLVFEIFEPKQEDDVPPSTVANGKATCPCCNSVLPGQRVQTQLSAQQGGTDVQFDPKGVRNGGATLLVVVTGRDGIEGRQYRLATQRDYDAVHAAARFAKTLGNESIPDEPINPIRPSPNARGLSAVTRYGMARFGDLFTARQKTNLAITAAKIADLPKRSPAEQAVAELAALALSRYTDISNSLCRWESTKTQVRNLFTRHAIAMLWDFAEADVFGENAGNYLVTLRTMARVVEKLQVIRGKGQVQQADAQRSPLPNDSVSVWFTDPPYYDAIPYADLSDFFYVWLRRVLPSRALLDSKLDTTTGLTPKLEECVWNQSYKINGLPKDGRFFETAIAGAFLEGRRVLRPEGVGCVVFAHKSTEGWEALLSGMLNAGFVITASWPITTELANRALARDAAALAGSVHLVCRPRPADAGVGDWSEVKAAMEKRIREWLPTLVKHGVRGADAIFSCLGPALESYSRYDKVLTAADREVPLGGNPDASEPHERGFLAYVFETLSKEALRQVLGDAETEGFEEDARMTALFLWTLQTTKANGNGGKPKASDSSEESDDDADDEEDEKPKKSKTGFSMPFDTFIRITRPMGIHYPSLEHRVIEIEKGVVRLLPVRERSEQLLGEAANRPNIEISLDDVKQMELGLITQRQASETLPEPKRRGRKASTPVPTGASQTVELTVLDRIHRAMLLFGLGRSTLLRQVLETEMRQSKRFERLALSLNALYPEGSDERRMLEGVQAAMRGIT